MTDLRPQLATKINLAAWRHTQASPHGDWRAVNAELGALRLLAMSLDHGTCGMGNAETARRLRLEHEGDNSITPAQPRGGPREGQVASPGTPHRQTQQEATG